MDAYPAEPHLPEPPQECPYGPLIEVLLSYRQADEDGVMCIVSRQAVHEAADALAAKDAEIERLRAENERLRKLDSESATHVESVICLRTEFTGDPPYVGWKGLGLALTEALNERDRLRARIAEKDEALRTIQTAAEFHAQDGVADHVMRYAHESTARLARKALEG